MQYTARFLPELVELLRDHRVSAEPLLKAARLAQDAGDRANDSAPVEQVEALLETSGRAIGIDGLGWQLGGESHRGAYGVAEICARSQPNVLGALQIFSRYYSLINPFQVTLESAPRTLLGLSWAADGRASERPQLNELGVRAILNVLSDAAASPIVPKEIRFAHAGGPSRALGAFARDSGVRLRFGEEATGFVFDRTTLQRALRCPDPELSTVLERLCEDRAASAATSFTNVLEQNIRQHLGTDLSIEAVSRRLGMSRRSLQRLLAAHRTSFASERARVLSEAARALLAQGVAIKEIALRLGYSNTTAFERAFHTWVGRSPAQWRAEAAKRSSGRNDR